MYATKKIVNLFYLFLLIAGIFIACFNEQEKDSKETITQSTEENISDDTIITTEITIFDEWITGEITNPRNGAWFSLTKNDFSLYEVTSDYSSNSSIYIFCEDKKTLCSFSYSSLYTNEKYIKIDYTGIVYIQVLQNNSSNYSFMVKKGPVLAPPENLHASGKPSEIILSWNRMENISGYILYKSLDDITYTLIKKIENPSETNYSFLYTPKIGDIYYFKIASYINYPTEHPLQFEGPKSTTLQYIVSVDNYTPAKPSASNDGNVIKITWNNITGIDGFRLYRSDSPDGLYTKIANDFNSSTFSYTDEDTSLNTNYYYKLSIFKNGVESSYSDYSVGIKYKYGMDAYENDDSEATAHNVLFTTNLYVLESHSIDINDIGLNGDYFKIINSTGTQKKFKITFSNLDLNGNSYFRITFGSSTHGISANNEFVTTNTVANTESINFKVNAPSFVGKYAILIESVNP